MPQQTTSTVDNTFFNTLCHYGLNAHVPIRLTGWNLIPSVMVLQAGSLGWLGPEGGALTNGIGAFIKETLESPPLLSHEDRVTRQPPVRQDGGPQQTPSLPVPSSWTSQLLAVNNKFMSFKSHPSLWCFWHSSLNRLRWEGLTKSEIKVQTFEKTLLWRGRIQWIKDMVLSNGILYSLHTTTSCVV